MFRHVDATPDFFDDVPRETPRPHLTAAHRACNAWRFQAHARRNHPHYKDMIEHLKALTRGEGRR